MLVKNIINTSMAPIHLHLTLQCPVLVSAPCDILYVYDWIINFILMQSNLSTSHTLETYLLLDITRINDTSWKQICYIVTQVHVQMVKHTLNIY